MKQKVDLLSITKIPPYTGENRWSQTLYLYKVEFHPVVRNLWDRLWNRRPEFVGVKEFANWGGSHFKDDKGNSIQANSRTWKVLVAIHDTLRIDYANFLVGYDPLPAGTIYVLSEKVKNIGNYLDHWTGVYVHPDFEKYRY